MATIMKPSFSIGAVGKSLYHRVDLQQHAYACKRVHNAIVLPSGAVMKRPGTVKTASAASNTTPSSLYTFRFSLTDVYVLEFNTSVIKVHKNGSVVATVTTAYSATEAAELSMAQLNDAVWIAHPAHALAQLVRITDTIWNLSDYAVGGATKGTDNTNTDANIQVTKLAGIGDNIYRYRLQSIKFTDPPTPPVTIFDETSIGKVIFIEKIPASGQYHQYRVESIATTVTNGVIAVGSDNGESGIMGTSIWAWASSDTGPAFDSAPSEVFLYQDRLCVAATITKPRTIWMSKTGIYNDFSVSDPVKDDDAIEIQITAGTDSSPTYWVEPFKYLVANTGASLVWLSSATGSGPVTGTSKQASVGSYTAFAATPPAKVRSELVAAKSDGQSIAAISVDTNSDEFATVDLTTLYPEIFSGKTIKKLMYQDEPWRLIWVLTTDGNLYSMSYDKDLQVTAWSTHELGAAAGQTAVINSFTITPASTAVHAETSTDLWLSVTRGATQVIERMSFVRNLGSSSIQYRDSKDGASSVEYSAEITPIMPAYNDSDGPVDADRIRIEGVNISLQEVSDFTVETAAGSETIAASDVSSSGNTGNIALFTDIDDDTDVTIKSSADAPFVMTAIRYEVEIT